MRRIKPVVSASLAILLTFVLAPVLFTACNQSAQELASEHAHDENADHSHEEQEPVEDHHAGEEEELGTIVLGEYTITVGQKGDIHPGEEGLLTISFAQQPEGIAVVRAWIGNEQADGVRKESAEKEDESSFHAHVSVPDSLPDGAQAWIEIQTAEGERLRKGIDFHHHD